MRKKLPTGGISRDLALLPKVLNVLGYVKPRKNISGSDINRITHEIQKDFLQVAQLQVTLALNGKKKLKRVRNPVSGKIGVVSFSSFKERGSPTVSLVKHYLLTMMRTREGSSFTPRSSFRLSKDGNIIGYNGYNCLGRAIALGCFLRIHRIHVRLGIVEDHSVVIATIKGREYFCDPMNYHMKLLHGTFTHHEGYSWYQATPQDRILFKYMVVHEFDRGMLNAIFQTFQFLRTADGKQFSKSSPYSRDEEKLLLFLYPKLGFRKAICSIDWGRLRRFLFKDLNAYAQDYQIELLIENARMSFIRKRQQVPHYFGEANLYAMSHADKRVKSMTVFLNRIVPIMRPHAKEVISFFRKGTSLEHILTPSIVRYLKGLKQILELHDEAVMSYGIRKISKRLTI